MSAAYETVKISWKFSIFHFTFLHYSCLPDTCTMNLSWFNWNFWNFSFIVFALRWVSQQLRNFIRLSRLSGISCVCWFDLPELGGSKWVWEIRLSLTHVIVEWTECDTIWFDLRIVQEISVMWLWCGMSEIEFIACLRLAFVNFAERSDFTLSNDFIDWLDVCCEPFE